MLQVFKYFNLKFLILGILFGVLAVYFTDNEKRIINVYPTPDNVNVIQFKDNADNCFSFESIQIDCPKDKSQIHTIPVQ
jgi:hypothetical protein|tara:strand:- start:281 stop:517 length:237 start_codon:yes stop_codon:yes gene_type:complete